MFFSIGPQRIDIDVLDVAYGVSIDRLSEIGTVLDW